MGRDPNDVTREEGPDGIRRLREQAQVHKPPRDTSIPAPKPVEKKPVEKWKAANVGYKSPPLAVLHPVSLYNKPVPPQRWIVPDWIPVGTTTLLYGDGGLGKSLLAMQLATACAIGKQWLGLDVEPVKALILSCEDEGEELQRRQARINEFYGIEFDELENLTWAPYVNEETSLMKFEKWDEEPPSATELFQQVHNAAMDFGAQLIIVDSLHDVFDGEENRRKHARSFIRLLNSFARDIEGAVVVACHPSVDGLKSGSGTSGSTAWNNTARSRLYFRRPEAAEADFEAEDVRILRRMKSNRARSGEEITVRWTDGAFAREFEVTGTLKVIEDRKDEKVFLACLDIAIQQGRALAESNRAGNYAPRIIATMNEAERIPQHRLEKALTRLFAGRQVEMGDLPFRQKNRSAAWGLRRVVIQKELFEQGQEAQSSS